MAHKICGILDAQGFLKNGVFYPREVALKSASKNICFLVDTKLDYENLNTRDKITNKFIEKNLLGIKLSSKNEDKSVSDFELELYKLYRSICTKEKKLIGVKNYQVAALLNSLAIPWIDLEEFGCQSMDVLELTYRETCCAFHHQHIKPVRGDWKCAQKKVNILYKWLKSRKTDL